MTREEALNYFKRRKDMGLSDMCQEAEDVAIQALSTVSRGDAISRQAVYDILTMTCVRRNDAIEIIGNIVGEVSILPPVRPIRPKGEWKKTTKVVMGAGYMWFCDKCHHEVYEVLTRPYPSEKFCPNCGADMRGEEHEGDKE